MEVDIEDLTKRFGEITAVDRISLQIHHGEFLCLLGPSGCGKTTLLRMLAGLEVPTDGAIRFQGRVVNDIPSYDRDVGMVFQNWALFPHKNVYENVSFGLKMKGVPEAQRRDKVAGYLELVHLPGIEKRMPSELSGGMQQRVALARALIVEPSLLLMDEPLSNLDFKLRQQMRFEIRQIQQRVGITTVFVTHDQVEALELADRVVVVNRGRVDQIGTPRDVYEAPRSRFVADFLGETNFLEGSVSSTDARTAVFVTKTGLTMRFTVRGPLTDRDAVSLSLRPQLIKMGSPDRHEAENNAFAGQVVSQTYLGAVVRYHIDLAEGTRLFVDTRATPGESVYPVGETVTLHWSIDAPVCLRDEESLS